MKIPATILITTILALLALLVAGCTRAPYRHSPADDHVFWLEQEQVDSD